jgi:hypothetical protein
MVAHALSVILSFAAAFPLHILYVVFAFVFVLVFVIVFAFA